MGIAILHRWVRLLVWLAVACAVGAAAYVILKPEPEDLPWTPLNLDRPIGLFTGRKVAGLTQDTAQCHALLEQSGLTFEEAPPGRSEHCSAPDAVRIEGDDPRLTLRPQGVAPSCPVTIGLALWQWKVVDPAAQRLFGSSVRAIRHYGSYSCRRLYGRDSGPWSEHATADAIDIAGFQLADGRRISVSTGWSSKGPEGAFLREVRNGACSLFSTVLSPDYNAQHRDHLHLDQAERGAMGWRSCR